jgi:hypothetical protein
MSYRLSVMGYARPEPRCIGAKAGVKALVWGAVNSNPTRAYGQANITGSQTTND